MRLYRYLSAAAVAMAAGVLTAGPGSALEPAPDPDIRSFPNGPVCSGDVFSGMVRIYSSTAAAEVPGTVELRYNSGGKVYTSTGVTTPITVRGKGSRDYAFSFNISGIPASSVNLRAYAVVGSPNQPIDTQLSKVVLMSSCAPAEVIPEAPVAALIPLTLAGTAGAVLVLSRRRDARVRATA